MMTLKLQIVIAIAILAILAVLVNMIRKRSLELKYALVWMMVLAALLIFDCAPVLLNIVSNFLGIYAPVNMIFFLGFCFSQILVYSVAYFGLLLLLVAWQKLRKERRNAVVMHRNRNGKTLAVFVFLLLCNTGIYTMGIWLELVVNPWVATFSMQLPIK